MNYDREISLNCQIIGKIGEKKIYFIIFQKLRRSVNCPLCGSANTRKKFTVARFDPPFDVFECGDCLFQFRDLSAADASCTEGCTDGDGWDVGDG
jgi:hypothetical protein